MDVRGANSKISRHKGIPQGIPTIRARLEALSDAGYRAFRRKLVPGDHDIIGVRMPSLRALAKEIARGDVFAYLDAPIGGSLEEALLHGLVIGLAKLSPRETLARAAAFVLRIDNWEVCDVFCGGLTLARTHREMVWDFLMPYPKSQAPYDLRFAAVMLLRYYADKAYLPRTLDLLAGIRSEHYYVRMAVAWAVETCFASDPEATLPLLESDKLDRWTHNKAIQKICESRQVSAEAKQNVRTLRRK